MHRVTLGVCVLAYALRAAVPAAAPFTQGQRLFADDFRGGLAQWTSELEKPGKVAARGGVLTVDVPAGCTLWFHPELQSAVMIQYEARMVQAGGPNDRVSDLNAFWMATDSRSPNDLFATKRSGKFSDYNQLRTYYVGQGGNSNTTTRFRRYIGDAVDRPLLPEHDLRSADMLLQPNVWQTVQLVALGDRIQYYRDGRLIFDFTDPTPYTRGRFGFRTTDSHVEVRNFQVYRITPAINPPVSAKESADSIPTRQRLGIARIFEIERDLRWPLPYVDGKRQAVALGSDAYYWDSVSRPDITPPGVTVPDNGNFRIQANPAPPRLTASPEMAEIVAPARRNGWFLFDVEVHYVLRRGHAYAVLRHTRARTKEQ